jgi:YbgC/YbaW family acyl-CoA thioester hydrolase
MPRIKIDMFENMLTVIPVSIRISDINYGNHVGNDAFVSIIHEARMQWLRQYGYTELDIEGAGLIMTDLAIQFKTEAFYGELIDIRLFAGDLSQVGFCLSYQLITTRNNDTILLANAKTSMVCFDYSVKKIVPLPGKLHEILNGN